MVGTTGHDDRKRNGSVQNGTYGHRRSEIYALKNPFDRSRKNFENAAGGKYQIFFSEKFGLSRTGGAVGRHVRRRSSTDERRRTRRELFGAPAAETGKDEIFSRSIFRSGRLGGKKNRRNFTRARVVADRF